MRCGCGKSTCNCQCGCKKKCTPECPSLCTALVGANSWTMPACDQEAVIMFPGLTTILIGSYLYNPTYGMVLVKGFNSINGQVIVENTCLAGNAAPGTMVPAGTEFVFGSPPTITELVPWTPALTLPVGSTLTINSQTVNQADLFYIGSTAWFTVSISFSLGGVADDTIYITLPFTSVADNVNVELICALINNNNVVEGRWRVDTTPTQLIFYRPLGDNFLATANNLINIQGFVKVS